jgi:hypothetical protein
MGLFGFLRKKKRIKGSIGYFGLQDWWLSAFSDEERRYIQEKFQPLGASGDSLTSGDISYTTETAVGLLHALAGWFRRKERSYCIQNIRKGRKVIDCETQILDVHFLYG